MAISEILLGVAFPIFIGLAVALAVSEASEMEFWVARACFMVGALDGAGLAVYGLWSAQISFSWKMALGAFIGGIILPALIFALNWVDVREFRISTKLVARNDPTPEMPLGCEPPPGSLIVLFGSNVAWSHQYPHTILQMADEPMLVVDNLAKTGELAVTLLRIFDDRDDIIARIDENSFWVQNTLRKKRPDKSRLFVYDHGDREVLKVEYLNPRVISVQGVFNHPRTRPASLVITRDALIHMPNNNQLNKGCFGGGGVPISVGARRN